MLTKTAVSAIRALLIIGREAQGEPLSPTVLAQAMDGSSSYLSKILGVLTKSGILISERGMYGGVRLAKPPEQITLLDVVEATQGVFLADYCQDVGTMNVETCAFHQAMLELHLALTLTLKRWTLAHLLAKPFPINQEGIPLFCRMGYHANCLRKNGEPCPHEDVS